MMPPAVTVGPVSQFAGWTTFVVALGVAAFPGVRGVIQQRPTPHGSPNGLGPKANHTRLIKWDVDGFGPKGLIEGVSVLVGGALAAVLRINEASTTPLSNVIGPIIVAACALLLSTILFAVLHAWLVFEVPDPRAGYPPLRRTFGGFRYTSEARQAVKEGDKRPEVIEGMSYTPAYIWTQGSRLLSGVSLASLYVTVISSAVATSTLVGIAVDIAKP